jgi:hypothetical protein
LGDYIEKNEMGRACSTYGGEVHTGIWWGNLRERDHLEDPGIDGRIILRWILRKWNGGGMDRIDLAEDRGRWQALVNAVMNLRGHKMLGISGTLFDGVSCGEVVGTLPMEDRKPLILHGVSSLCCSLQARMNITLELQFGMC